MKTLFNTVLIALLAILSFSCTDESTSVVQSENTLMKSGPSANGQGTLIINGKNQTFSFHAQDNEGIVTGSVQCNIRDLGIVFHGNINCMVINGNEAILSGEIIHDNGLLELYPDYPYFLFKVIDNGEGLNAPPDEFSDIYAYIDYYPCDWEYPSAMWYMQPIVNGNFQVKP